MAFKERANLDTETTITLGGKTKDGKANPTKIEGYFLGTKAIGPNKFNKSKTDYVHIIKTPKGNVGVWGKTNLDQKLDGLTSGVAVRITYTGTKDTGKGNPMLCYKVEVDEDNTTDVSGLEATTQDDTGVEYNDEDATDYASDEEEEGAVDEEEAMPDEVPPARAAAPAKRPPVSDAARQAKVQALLNGRGKAKTN